MSAAPARTQLSEGGYEVMTMAFWLARVSDLDDVTIIVRRHGRIVRTVVVSPDGDATPRMSGASAPPRPAPGE